MDLYVHNATSSNFAEGTQAATRWLPSALPARANTPGAVGMTPRPLTGTKEDVTVASVSTPSRLR